MAEPLTQHSYQFHSCNGSTQPQQQQSQQNHQQEFALRSYQDRIAAAAVQNNTIVVLPTGTGKTIIAAEVILRVGTPVLFLVPTVHLVQQQESLLRNWTELDVKPYSGGSVLPESFHILVSTPKAFEAAQAENHNSHLRWESFRVIVFDEVHHVLKEHPYRKLALSLHANHAQPRVLGLTASYTYAVGEEQARASLQRMCDELRITQLETASEEELRAFGFHTKAIHTEIPHASIKADAPPGVLPHESRKPHLMLKIFFSRVLHNEATPFASILAKCVLQMEVSLAERDPSFTTPIQASQPLKQWGQDAHRIAATNVTGLGFLYGQLEHWYEALRLLIVSWEEDEYAVVLFLRMLKCDTTLSVASWPLPVADAVRNFWDQVPDRFRRLDNLRSVLIQKYKDLAEFRGLLFVQQRIMTHILEYFIASDPKLNAMFKTASLYSSSSPATSCFSVSKAQAQSRMADFAKGRINLLITTVVAEEGMDVPSANCVIRFDAMQHTVSLVQGRGRARQQNSAFVVLSERSDRPIVCLEAAEKHQIDLIRTFQPKPSNEVFLKTRQAQVNRERNAKDLLVIQPDISNAIDVLRLFCQKTKAPLETRYIQRAEDYAVEMKYSTVLRAIATEGAGLSKKAAASQAALEMITMLRQQVLSE